MITFRLGRGTMGRIVVHADGWDEAGRITFSGVPQSVWREVERALGLHGHVAIREGQTKAADLEHALRTILPGQFEVDGIDRGGARERVAYGA
jgi:hypothetical protein